MTRFPLIFILFQGIVLLSCANIPRELSKLPTIDEGDYQVSFNNLVGGEVEQLFDRVIEEEEDDEISPFRMVTLRGSCGSLTDLTTEDSVSSSSMMASSYHSGRPPRKCSIDSIEKFHAEEDEGLISSAFFVPTVISETISENSDETKAEDCFEGRAVHQFSMDWIQSNFVPYLKSGNRLLPKTLYEILDFVKEVFSNEPTVFNVPISADSELFVVGDIHGQFDDLIRIFEQNGYPSLTRKFIFNGDVVDRGPNSIECLITLFLMKICHPLSVFITRGNHESHTCGDGTFKEECFQRIEEPLKFFFACHEIFNVLPLGYTINNTYFVCHGGLPYNFDLRMIKDASKPDYTPVQQVAAMAMLWNDPHDGYGMRGSNRGGATLSFGKDVTFDFLYRHNFKLLIRSHEYHKDGYFFCHDNFCLTIFSAPNYCGIGNKGTVMKIKDDLSYEIIEIIVPLIEESFSLKRVKERGLTLNLDEGEFVFPCHFDEEQEEDKKEQQSPSSPTLFWPGFF